MSKDKDYIFVSFSQRETARVAEIITQLINTIYPKNTKSVGVFLSSAKIGAGRFKGRIMEAMQDAKFAISILSPENVNAPWLMFEAGALSLAVERNGGHLMPYLFCRHGSEVEPTIKDLQYSEYQKNSDTNQENLVSLIKSLNSSLSKENKVTNLTIGDKINDAWGEMNKELDDIAYNLYHPSASSLGVNALDSTSNDAISIDNMGGNLATYDQDHIRLADDFFPATPGDIEKKFEQILRTQIPQKWKHRNDEDSRFNATRVVVNATRFSTFVVFTDGQRIILFDREKDRKNTSVLNDRFDVFGSVQFENRTIKNKIKNPYFFQSKIIKVEEISGAAIEDNRLKTSDEKETAVMFGVCIYLTPKDLELAKVGIKKDEIVIHSLSSGQRIKDTLLTSKAYLGIGHIIQAMATTKHST